MKNKFKKKKKRADSIEMALKNHKYKKTKVNLLL